MATTQKALYIPSSGADFEIKEREIPSFALGEVVIKVKSIGINPADWMLQKGILPFIEHYPALIGSDAAGVIHTHCPNVDLRPGDRVVWQPFFGVENQAGFQEYVVAPRDLVAKIPDSISFEEAATIPTGLSTAGVGLYDKSALNLTPFWAEDGRGKYAGQPIVIIGGSSTIGHYFIQLARLSGFSPIVTTAAPKHASLLKSLGATHVVDRSGNVAEEIKKVLSSGLAGVVVDCIAQDAQGTPAIVEAVSKSDAKVLVSLQVKHDLGSRSVFGVFGSATANRDTGVPLYQALPGLLESGELKPVKPEVVSGGLSGIPEACERLQAGKVSGAKLVVNL